MSESGEKFSPAADLINSATITKLNQDFWTVDENDDLQNNEGKNVKLSPCPCLTDVHSSRVLLVQLLTKMAAEHTHY